MKMFNAQNFHCNILLLVLNAFQVIILIKKLENVKLLLIKFQIV